MVFNDSLYMKELSIIEMECFPYEDVLMTEAEEEKGKGIFQSLITFIKKLIDSIHEKVLKVIDDVQQKVRKASLSKNIKAVRKSLEQKERAGVDMVDFYDVWEYEKTIKKALLDLDVQTEAFLLKYKTIGSGLAATDRMLKKVNDTMDKYDKKLKSIQDHKIHVKTTKVLDWLDEQTKSGRPKVFSFADDYEKKLKKYQDMVKEFDEKADKFAKDNKVYRKPTGATQHLRNMTSWVERNISWLGMIIGGVGVWFVGQYPLDRDRESIRAEIYKKDPPRGDSMLHNPRTIEREVDDRINRADTKHPKVTRAAKGTAAVGQAMVADGVAVGIPKAVLDRRNSV